MASPKKEKLSGDLFSTAEVLKLVIQKLASQSLLFGLAVIVILAGAWKLFGRDSLPLVGAILFVFIVALAGYLFLEQKKNVSRHDPVTLRHLTDEKMNSLRNPASDFNVELWTAPAALEGARNIVVTAKKKKADYRLGEKIAIGFRASRDCYLTLLNIGTSGKLTVLFPNAMHRDNFIQAAREYRIPEAGDDFEYQLQGPPGVEKLKAIATVERTALLESNFAPDGSLFRTVSAPEGARDITVVQKKVASLSPDHWAEGGCEFSVS